MSNLEQVKSNEPKELTKVHPLKKGDYIQINSECVYEVLDILIDTHTTSLKYYCYFTGNRGYGDFTNKKFKVLSESEKSLFIKDYYDNKRWISYFTKR